MGFLFALSFVIIQLEFPDRYPAAAANYQPLEEVGYYSLGVSIAEKLWQLPFAIGMVLMSRTVNATDQEAINRTTAKLVRVSLLAGLIASIILYLLSPWVVPAIWGEKFRPSILIIQYILPGILFISVYPCPEQPFVRDRETTGLHLCISACPDHQCVAEPLVDPADTGPLAR